MIKYFNVEIDMAGKYRIRAVDEDNKVTMLKFDTFPTLEQIEIELSKISTDLTLTPQEDESSQ